MIRLVKPYIAYEDVKEELKEIFSSGVFTKGKYSQLLPARLAEYTGAAHAFLTTSATTALSMCLKLLEIGTGDEVIVSDFSFPASCNVVEDLGANSVLADVSLETFNMLPSELLTKITPNTKAVIFVDALGNPSGLEKIADICRERKIPLIEDAACAFGSNIGKRKVGSIADLTCFSMHPRKLLTTGEGGAITTNNEVYASKLKVKLNHGADETGDFITFGYNYRMPEIACAMACRQLESIDEVVIERREQYETYTKHLEPLGFTPQRETGEAYTNRQSVVFSIPAELDRDALIEALRNRQIETTLGTYSLSATSYYRQKYRAIQPNALWLQQHTITLPCYRGLALDEVCSAVDEAIISL